MVAWFAWFLWLAQSLDTVAICCLRFLICMVEKLHICVIRWTWDLIYRDVSSCSSTTFFKKIQQFPLQQAPLSHSPSECTTHEKAILNLRSFHSHRFLAHSRWPIPHLQRYPGYPRAAPSLPQKHICQPCQPIWSPSGKQGFIQTMLAFEHITIAATWNLSCHVFLIDI